MSEEKKDVAVVKTKLPERFSRPSEIGLYLKQEKKLSELQEVVPKGTGVNAKSIVQGIMLAVMTNPMLLDCTSHSVLQCAAASARYGLPLDPALKMSYMVPRKTKTKSGNYEWSACFQPSYRGLIALMKRAGVADFVETQIVYSKDFFEVKPGMPPEILHAPNFNDEDRGDMLGVYAIAYKEGKIVGRKYMTKAEVLARKRVSQTDMIWKAWPAEMWAKTAIHALCKTMPMSLEVIYAADHEQEYSQMQRTEEGEVSFEAMDAEFEIVKESGSELNEALKEEKASTAKDGGKDKLI